MIWQVSYHTAYQPKAPISAFRPSAVGLIWVSRVDMGYDTKLPYNNPYILSFAKDIVTTVATIYDNLCLVQNEPELFELRSLTHC